METNPTEVKIEPNQSSPPDYLILGTAGHIDHGKTTLVKALSGKNTDRLIEEQKRGITIELGFAHLSCPPFEFGIVDVPGHQKFVKTMLAGSTGVDVVLLVVAADDSINQQTREHLDILRFLDVPAGIIAITKCDKVDSAWLELVEDEIRQLVQGTFLADSPIIQTSATTGAGLNELKTALVTAGSTAIAKRKPLQSHPFRMPIDRVFSIEGHGTIVTGSVTHGQVSLGQSVQLLPDWPDREIRIRQIQTHDRKSETAVRGQRAALNLVGVSVEDVQRGFQLSAPGAVPISHCLTVQLTASEIFADGVSDHQEIRVHLATTEVLGKVRFLQAQVVSEDNEEEEEEVLSSPRIKKLGPGQQILAQLHLQQPVAAVWGQRIVVRRPSPGTTIGSAVVIDPQLQRMSKLDSHELQLLADLGNSDALSRMTASVYFRFDGQLPALELQARFGVSQQDCDQLLGQLSDDLVQQNLGNTTQYFHSLRLKKLEGSILGFLDTQHTGHPKRWFIDRILIEKQFHYVPLAVLDSIIKRLEKGKRLRISPMGIGLMDRGPVLTKNQQKLLEQLLLDFQKAGFAPPSVKQCVDSTPKNKQDVPELLKMATQSGDLVPIDNDVYLAKAVFDAAWQKIELRLQANEGLSVSEIRDILEVTRKLAVPFCEYLDRQNLTVRRDDKRYLPK